MATLRHATSRHIALALLAVGMLAAARPAAAGSSWRCGNRLVTDGQSAYEVGRVCGAPDFRTASVEYVTVRVGNGTEVTRAVPVEVWTYNRGPRQFVRFLTFRDDHLVDVSEGDYGW